MSLMQCISFAASTAALPQYPQRRAFLLLISRRVRDRSERIADREEDADQGLYHYRNVVGSVVVALMEEGIPDMVASANELFLATPAMELNDTECLHPGDHHNRRMRADILYSAQEREVG